MFEVNRITWARRFDDAASDKLVTVATPVTAVPFTMGCWFNSDDITIRQFLMMVGTSANNDNRFSLELRGDVGGDPVYALTEASAAASQAASTTGYQANRWHHATAVYAAANDRRIYLDGGGFAQETTSRTPAGINKIAVGCFSGSSDALRLSGLVMWPYVIPRMLTGADVMRLAAGEHPMVVGGQGTLFWDFYGRSIENDRGALYPLTNTGSVPVPGPAFLRDRIPRVGFWGAGAAVAGSIYGTVFNSPVIRASRVRGY